MTWLRVVGIISVVLGIAGVIYSFSQSIVISGAAGIGTINLVTICPGVLLIVFGLILALVRTQRPK